jgi:beta-ketodecanoyl-[acyl-carrier-protein] synthase
MGLRSVRPGIARSPHPSNHVRRSHWGVSLLQRCVLTGSGLYTPPESISNEELVASHITSVRRFNSENEAEIAAGRVEARIESDVAFIEKASGIERRYVMEKSGVLDPERMAPRLPLRGEDEPSLQCEMSLAAISEALEQAGRSGEEVDAVIVACSNLQRPYPAVAVEVQHGLGATGWAYDLNVACSSATFGIQAAVDAVAAGHARCAVVVNPEITSGHNNFELRDSHFIFGDACTAVVIEPADNARGQSPFEILGTRLETSYSNNIRNDFGFLNRSEEEKRDTHELLFRQNGRRVFKDVCPMVARHIEEHLKDEGLEVADVKRLWLHQANLGMNQVIGRRVLGRDPTREEAPVILDEWANTSSAGSVIAFHRYKADLARRECGVLCSFGAGYSIGSAILRRV